MHNCFLYGQRIALAMSLILLSSFSANNVIAKETPRENMLFELDELFVTANKEAQPLKFIPGGVGVIKKEIIENTTTNALSEVLARIPGVTVQNRFGTDDVRIAIRGAGNRSNFGIRSVIILLDGMPITEADGQSRIDIIDLASIERIEVIKGPSSSIYGGNATGGVVNLIIKMGEAGHHMDNRIQLGSYSFAKGYISALGGTDKLKYNIHASHTTKNGYRIHSDTFGDRIGINMDYTPNEDSRLQFMFSSVHVDIFLPGSLTLSQFNQDPQQARARNITNDFARFDRRYRVGGKFTRKINPDLEGSISLFTDFRELEHPIFQYLDIARIDHGGDFRLKHTNKWFGYDNKLLYGFNFQRLNSDQRDSANVGGNPGVLRADEDAYVDSLGFYVQDEFSIMDNLKLTAGARYSHMRYELVDHFGANSEIRDYDRYNPSVGLTWQPKKNITLYTTYSTAFETPTLSELTSGATTGFRNIEPIEAVNYEVGTRGNFSIFNRSATYEFAVFRSRFENEILPQTIGFTTTFSNAGDTVHDGVEVAFGMALTDSIKAAISYAYSDFKFTSGNFDGNEIPGQATHVLQGNLDYRVPLSGKSTLDAGLEVLYSGEYALNDVNSHFNDNYVVFGFNLNYKRDKLGVFMNIQNLTDENYSPASQINDRAFRFYNPADGRAITMGLTHEF